MTPWIAFGISGWIACGLIFWATRARGTSDPEKQLQETAREFASHKRQAKAASETQSAAHQAQMDAIRADIVEFGLTDKIADPTAVKNFLDRMLSKTKKRGERA